MFHMDGRSARSHPRVPWSRTWADRCALNAPQLSEYSNRTFGAPAPLRPFWLTILARWRRRRRIIRTPLSFVYLERTVLETIHPIVAAVHSSTRVGVGSLHDERRRRHRAVQRFHLTDNLLLSFTRIEMDSAISLPTGLAGFRTLRPFLAIAYRY